MDKNIWFIHIEFVVVLVTLLGGFYTLDGKIERQGARTDKLYELYCESNAEMNEKWAVLSKENNEKWAELKAESNAKWIELKVETNELRTQMLKR